MYKQELIQLHALCVLVRSHLEDSPECPADAFRSYDRYGVGPTDVYRRKEDHRAALFRLLDGLETAIEGSPPPSSRVPSSPGPEG